MDEKFRNLPLRNGVGIIVLNQQNKIFVAKRIDNPRGFCLFDLDWHPFLQKSTFKKQCIKNQITVQIYSVTVE